MKKSKAIAGLYIRQTMYKVLLVNLLAIAVYGLLFVIKDQHYVTDLSMAYGDSHVVAGILLAFLATNLILFLGFVFRKSYGNETIRRLPIGQPHMIATLAVTAFLENLAAWLLQVSAVAGLGVYYGFAHEIVGNRVNVVYALENNLLLRKLVWIGGGDNVVLILVLLVMLSITAGIYNGLLLYERGSGALLLLAVAVLLLITGLGHDTIYISLLAVIPVGVADGIMVFQLKGEVENAGKEI